MTRMCSDTTPVLYNNVLKFESYSSTSGGGGGASKSSIGGVSAFDVLLPVVVSGGMTFLFYVEPILFAYCKNVDKSRTSIPQLYRCALKE